MKIAITSQNRRQLTAHAGKCSHFYVYDTDANSPPASIVLSPSESLHNWSGQAPHPLKHIDVLISGSIGTGVAQKLAQLGIRTLVTSERDPARVLEQFLDGSLPVGPIRSESDARSTPGSCLPQPLIASSLILGNWHTPHN